MVISFIGCVKLKLTKSTTAEKMYISTLFKYTLEYAKQHSDLVFILSAKYGLLNLGTVIEPYNETLNGKSDKEIKDWSKKIYRSVLDLGLENNQFLYLCGENYKKYLKKWLPGNDPLNGLGLGKRLKWLKNNTKKTYNILGDY